MAATALSAGIYLAVDGQAPPELDLGWQEPATSPVPITGYFIFRATSPSGPFSQLNSVAQTQTSYVDSSVQNGVTYYYHVESVATDGITSLPSSTVQVLAANPVAFGNQTLGSSTSLRTVVVTNSGSEVLTFGSIGLTGPSASQFATSNNCGTSLAARDSCTISLRFDPNAAGTHAAYISLSDNANGSPQSIPLAGTGVDFTQPPSSMQFNGAAGLSGTALQLTNGGENEAGSVFYKTPVNVQSFTTDFTFELSNPSADGLTFTIQNVGPTALGYSGGGLGYGGIGKSVAVKFDLYNNVGEGADSTGIYIDGAMPAVPSVNLSGTGINLHSGDPMSVHMTYDGTYLTVTLTDDATLAMWSDDAAVNIPSAVGGTTAYVGFTGGTGGLTANQKVTSWTYVSEPPAVANYPNGFLDGSQLRLNGAAGLSGTALQLTNGGENEAGSVFYKTPVNVQSFTTDFTFELSNPSADGLTFTIQNVGPTALGYSGGGLGYGGIGKSVAVKFDLYNNVGEGADSTGIYIDGAMPAVPSVNLSGTGINLHSGDPMSVHMTYDGTYLTVTLTDDATLAVWSFDKAVNIPSAVGRTTAYVGFTGGTGGLTATQKILSWVFGSP